MSAAGRTYRYIGLAMPNRKGTHCTCLVWPPGRASKKNALVQQGEEPLLGDAGLWMTTPEEAIITLLEMQLEAADA